MFTREVDNSIYNYLSLLDSKNAYEAYCDVQIYFLPANKFRVSLVIRNEFLGDAKHIILEFWNYFLDASCKSYLESK